MARQLIADSALFGLLLAGGLGIFVYSDEARLCATAPSFLLTRPQTVRCDAREWQTIINDTAIKNAEQEKAAAMNALHKGIWSAIGSR